MFKTVNFVVVCTTLCMQLTVTSLFYFSLLRDSYTALIYGQPQSPKAPLRSLLGSMLAMLGLLTMLQILAVRFQVNTWQEGLLMAAVLWGADASMSVREFLFEAKPASLYLMHLVYRGITLGMACGLLAQFGTPSGAPAVPTQ